MKLLAMPTDAHLAVTEDSSLLRGYARVLDLRQEALEVRPGLLVAVEAGQRLLPPHALRRPARTVICFLTSSDQIYFLFLILLSSCEKSESQEMIERNKCITVSSGFPSRTIYFVSIYMRSG